MSRSNDTRLGAAVCLLASGSATALLATTHHLHGVLAVVLLVLAVVLTFTGALVLGVEIAARRGRPQA